MPERIAKHYWIRFQRAFRKIARSHGTPRDIALGLAIGMFIGMTPTVGLQMILSVIVATIFGANRLAAILPVWITNPATIIPIYSFNYYLGTLITGGPGIEGFKQDFGKVIAAADNDGIVAALKEMGEIGMEIQLPLWTGCVIVGLALALPSYYFGLKFVLKFREALDKRRADRHERVTTIISQRISKNSRDNGQSPCDEECDMPAPHLSEDEPVEK
ncbi:MAG: DUF2062 domain-containing protein [Planctomycetes bacterium]|nr:DUF2062 domain-containing protein [Planctomycetota bacterium]